MFKNIFKLSDDAKYSLLFDLINPNYNEEGQWELNSIIMDVYDNYAVTYNCKEKYYERVYYTKDDEKDEISISSTEKCFIVDVTESEKQALSTIQALNGGTYEKVDETYSKVDELEKANNTLTEEKTQFEQKIEEQTNSIATLTSERDEASTKFVSATEQIESLTNELNSLKEFKLNKETEEKQAIINKYAVKLNEDIVKKYTESMSEYSLDALDKELAFELVKSTPSIFSLEEGQEDLLPKPDDFSKKSALEETLDRFANK